MSFGVVVLFSNQTVDGTSEPYLIKDGGYRILKASGVFDGATITIEVDYADDDYAPIQAYQFTQDDVKYIQPLRPGLRIRGVLTNAGANTDVNLKLL